jgi:hypothetical protein
MKQTLLLLIIALIPSLTFACRGGENTPPDTLENAYKKASIVFIGTVAKITVPSPSFFSSEKKDVAVTFKVDRSFKGALKDKLYTFPVQTGRSCDLDRSAEMNSRWLILVNKDGEKLITGSHSKRFYETLAEEKATEELMRLK